MVIEVKLISSEAFGAVHFPVRSLSLLDIVVEKAEVRLGRDQVDHFFLQAA